MGERRCLIYEVRCRIKDVRFTKDDVRFIFSSSITFMTAEEMKARTKKFAINVAKLIQSLESNRINNAYCGQLIRCSSSVGANYRAAQRANSTADFINKLKIIEEETDESIYFLEYYWSLMQRKAWLQLR